MNRTLENLQSIADEAAAQKRQAEEKRLAELKRLAKEAEPLFDAYADLEQQFVRISILKKIWDKEFDVRGDRLSSLVLGFVEESGQRYGIRFRSPAGQLKFFVDTRVDGAFVYRATSDAGDGRANSKEYIDRDEWMRHFLSVMAQMLELRE